MSNCKKQRKTKKLFFFLAVFFFAYSTKKAIFSPPKLRSCVKRNIWYSQRVWFVTMAASWLVYRTARCDDTLGISIFLANWHALYQDMRICRCCFDRGECNCCNMIVMEKPMLRFIYGYTYMCTFFLLWHAFLLLFLQRVRQVLGRSVAPCFVYGRICYYFK